MTLDNLKKTMEVVNNLDVSFILFKIKIKKRAH